MKRTLVVALLLLIFGSYVLKATTIKPNPQFYYRQLDNRNGLSNSSVNAILQDKDQLLWIGTWDGLNRYDGAQFNVYNHNIDPSKNSIGSNVIQAINEDNAGNIWVNTIGGISRYHKKTGKFYRYFYRSTTSKKVSENEFEIAINTKGEVYCYSADGILSKYKATEDKFITYKRFAAAQGIVKMHFVNDLLWCLNKKNELTAFKIDGNQLTSVMKITDKVSNFFVANNQIIYSLNNSTHYKIGLNLKIEQIGIAKKGVKAIVFYQNNYVVAWENQGISLYDNKFNPSALLQTETKKLENLKITALRVSSDDVLWIGTDGNGLVQIYPKENYFGLLTKVNCCIPH